ncbi:MAG: hypothetical protein HY561_01540 [Gemmatimonadetes bacterium]|nr:hypothetical protein [Gemmatimonadota bacterium]
MFTPQAKRVRSLAAARSGETLEIRHILFDALRCLCSDLGVHEGQAVRCRAATPSHLLLETAEGRTVALETDWARFIQVGEPGFEGAGLLGTGASPTG